MSDVTLILQAVALGEKKAADELLPLVYDELRRLAGSRMGHLKDQTLQPTALVHEAWLRLVNEEGRTWRNREHFFRVAAQAMRSILVDRARRKLSLKRGGGNLKLSLEDLDLAAPVTDERVLLVDESLGRLETEDPESARLISLKFFAGLTNQEVANILGVTERTVERRWAFARASMFRLMKQGL
jgi:RNA polymerase sigma factor (TIGR02999 family)